MIEIYEHDAGKLVVVNSDTKSSSGLLILNPKSDLAKHNRPVSEQLTQVYGSCTMELFENANVNEIILNEGDNLEIPTNQFHIHANPNNSLSITMWKFEGDVTEVIASIRKSMRRIK